MPDVHSGLTWWPPADDEPIGDDRARELVRQLTGIAPPIVDDAENDLRSRLYPDAAIVRSGAPARYFATFACSPGMRSLCVGTVYREHGGDPRSNSIRLQRDGALSWRRER